MTNNLDYPNMEFPYKYTKLGQKELVEKYVNQTLNDTPKTENIENHTENNNSNMINLLTTLLNNQNKVEGLEKKDNGIDISKLLSMLINKNLKQTDLINMLIPLLTNNLNKKQSSSSKNTDDVVASTKKLLFKTGYKKVE